MGPEQEALAGAQPCFAQPPSLPPAPSPPHAYSVLCCKYLAQGIGSINIYWLNNLSIPTIWACLTEFLSCFKFATEKCMLPCSKRTYMLFFLPLKGTHQTTRRGHTLDHSWEITDLSSSRDLTKKLVIPVPEADWYFCLGFWSRAD